MILRELVGTAEVPGGAPLSLYRRGADYMISLGRNELMSTRMSGSEVALATMTLERLGNPPAPRVLVGGYGMGFTLRALLGATGSDADLVVAEITPDIIDWAHGPMAELTAGCFRVGFFFSFFGLIVSVLGFALSVPLPPSDFWPAVSAT